MSCSASSVDANKNCFSFKAFWIKFTFLMYFYSWGNIHTNLIKKKNLILVDFFESHLMD